MSRPQRILDIECPKCGSPSGYKCFAQKLIRRNIVNSSRREVKPHGERKEAYRIALQS